MLWQVKFIAAGVLMSGQNIPDRTLSSSISNFASTLEKPNLCLFRHVIDDCFQIIRFIKLPQLTIGAGAHLQNLANIGDFFVTIELIDDFGNEVEIFENQFALGYFHLLPEVDEFAIKAVSHGAPFILHDERA